MSHATYCYLVDGLNESEEPDFSEMVGHAESCVEEYIGKAGDSNNWYTSLLLVTSEGDLVPVHDEIDKELETEGDKHWLISLPGDQRFDTVKRFALGCIATDMKFRDSNAFMGKNEAAKKLDDLSYDDLLLALLREVPGTLSLMYAELLGLENPLVIGNYDQDDYARRKLSKRFELLRDSVVFPFATGWPSPYDYRCVDLRENYYDNPNVGPGTGIGIVLVDVHT